MIHVKMNKESRKFLNLARKLAVQNRSDIKFDFDTANSIKISTNITMQLSDTKSNTLDNVKINKNNNIKALIAENNSHAFKILKKDLELIGVEVKPSGDWRIIKRHIEDVIFNPDIVFIQSAIINTAAFKEIESFFVDKNIAMVIIKNNKYQYKLDSKIYIQYLPQPYTPDVLINILNNIQNYRLSGKRNTLITL
ncbi:hypothetical protein ACHJH3_05405 [Campylobacter sp. MOP7]|uniref:hypothetical protein n=1 Tax=Campylobacter canis TaxID=3378588 RepID=UPI00387E7CD6